MPLSSEEIKKIQQLDANERLSYTCKTILAHQQVWILTDQHGCMMLNTEDEDCVPIWPNQEFAELWITGDWQACKAEMIPLAKWLSRWTQGLMDDDLSLVIFPNEQEEGIVLFPDEFEDELNKTK